MLNQQTMTLTNWLFRASESKIWNRPATHPENLSSSGQSNRPPSVQELGSQIKQTIPMLSKHLLKSRKRNFPSSEISIGLVFVGPGIYFWSLFLTRTRISRQFQTILDKTVPLAVPRWSFAFTLYLIYWVRVW